MKTILIATFLSVFMCSCVTLQRFRAVENELLQTRSTNEQLRNESKIYREHAIALNNFYNESTINKANLKRSYDDLSKRHDVCIESLELKREP